MKKIVAIYSRKSKFTSKGDSIENQIEMCKDYINSNISKDVEFTVYEDEGFSGGNIDRPNFKKMMTDISKKKINILVCYRLDRISRNVADFSSTLELLQSNNCDFISIREQFDTSSPMGRAMIYIASVFAQLERETIAERVKDNMVEMAKNGRWTGGKIPVGFTSEKIKLADENGITKEKPQLVINKDEAELVTFLYKKYLELGSLHKLECYIAENQIKSKNNVMYEKSSLKIILQNPVYVKGNLDVINYLKNNNWTVYGEADNLHSLLTYNKTEQTKKNGKYKKQNKPIDERLAAISTIEGFIEPDLWLKVQKQFDTNKEKFPRLGKTNNALLVSKLKCGKCGQYMLVQHGKLSKVTGDKLFYYMCSLKRKSHKILCDNNNAKASEIESYVILSLKKLGQNKQVLLNKTKDYYLKKFNSTEKDTRKLLLQKSLADKKNQIDNLVNKLSISDDIVDILIEKIKILKCEYLKIQEAITLINSEKENIELEMLNIELIEQLLDKCTQIDTLDRNEQKYLIENIVDEIFYFKNDNGDDEVKIKIIGANSDDNTIEHMFSLENHRLQNYSPSTC